MPGLKFIPGLATGLGKWHLPVTYFGDDIFSIAFFSVWLAWEDHEITKDDDDGREDDDE